MYVQPQYQLLQFFNPGPLLQDEGALRLSQVLRPLQAREPLLLLHEHRPTEPAVREWAWHYGRGIMGVHCNSGYTVWYIEFGHLVEDYP